MCCEKYSEKTIRSELFFEKDGAKEIAFERKNAPSVYQDDS